MATLKNENRQSNTSWQRDLLVIQQAEMATLKKSHPAAASTQLV
jgi:hypothetical protein